MGQRRSGQADHGCDGTLKPATVKPSCAAKIPADSKIKKKQFSFEPAVTKSFGARIFPWMNILIAETTGLRAVSAI
jgi:hypothetical protein